MLFEYTAQATDHASDLHPTGDERQNQKNGKGEKKTANGKAHTESIGPVLGLLFGLVISQKFRAHEMHRVPAFKRLRRSMACDETHSGEP
jgi:hypothetical protein